ncbi:MAG: CHAT domain-containing protein [Syntrophobacteraceae bacterium]
MGLTRAFMYAGTPAISVTLWSVESISEKTLSTGIYENLKADRGRAAALRKIKLIPTGYAGATQDMLTG